MILVIMVALSWLLSSVPPAPVEPATVEPAPIAEPSAEPPAPEQPPEGGFGSVTTVTTDSNVAAPPPSSVPAEGDPEADPESRRELSLRAELGYGQADLANAEPLDHQGAFLRAHLGFYPWVSRSRRVGVGIGVLYSYQGVNRRQLPADAGIDRSKGQQQQIAFSLPLLLRPHRDWFSIQPSAMLGFGFYMGGEFWAADRRVSIPASDYALVVGGDLALCSVWDIVCVVGGSDRMFGTQTAAADTTLASPAISPWGWHVGVGLDILRIFARGNRVG